MCYAAALLVLRLVLLLCLTLRGHCRMTGRLWLTLTYYPTCPYHYSTAWANINSFIQQTHTAHHVKVAAMGSPYILHYTVTAVQNCKWPHSDTGHVSADRLHLKEKARNYCFNKNSTCAESSGFCAWMKAKWINCSWSGVWTSRGSAQLSDQPASRIPPAEAWAVWEKDRTLTWLNLLNAHVHSSAGNDLWYGDKTAVQTTELIDTGSNKS